MINKYPNRKIGIVTFGNDVTLYGDCWSYKKILSGKILDN